MDYLTRSHSQASAGSTLGVALAKPSGDRIVIRQISVRTVQLLSFGRWDAYLSKPDSNFRVTLTKKIVPETQITPALLFDGERDWNEGWNLGLKGKSQVDTEIARWTVAYEIEPKIKKRWW